MAGHPRRSRQPGRTRDRNPRHRETLQQGRISDLVFDIPSLVACCASFTELLPGDLIATGTPSGAGAGRTPPRWRERGDVVELDLGPIGCLRNTVAPE
jgi:2-keto-4-pentenoate hydratase/2-oxohepta-3-ene-1,7-dioic acid hydratase in catechol pathway